MTTTPTTKWIMRPRPDPSAPLRLFCLPYAGGGAAAYRPWVRALAGVAEVVPLLLPGRESRFAEPAADRVDALVPGLVDGLAPELAADAADPRPYAVFGHSMGALIAFELCRALRDAVGARSSALPSLLVVSG